MSRYYQSIRRYAGAITTCLLTASSFLTYLPANAQSISTLADSLTRPRHIALDDEFVYWHETDGNTTRIRRVPRIGGAIELLATDFDGNGGSGASELAVDQDHVYWVTNRGFGTGTLKRVPKNGGSVTLLANTNQSCALELDESFAYWVDCNGGTPNRSGVRRVLKTGGSTETLTNSGNSYSSIAVSTESAFFDYFSSSVRRIASVSLDGGAPVDILVDAGSVTDLTYFEGRLYWISPGAEDLRSMKIDGSDFSVLHDGFIDPVRLTISGRQIYITDRANGMVEAASVVRYSLDEETAEVFLPGLANVFDVEVDSQFFYVTSGGVSVNTGSILAFSTQLCADGVVPDDGTPEGALGTNTQGGYVQLVESDEPFVLKSVCVGWQRDPPAGVDSQLPYRVVVLEDDGPGNTPGTLLGEFSSQTSAGLGSDRFIEQCVTGTLDISFDGRLYVGVLWDGALHPGFSVSVDKSSATPTVRAFESQDDGLSWSELPSTLLKALFVRADIADVVPEASPPRQSTLVGDVDTTLPTIVLTHGLQPRMQDPEGLWTGFSGKQAGRLLEDELAGGEQQFNVLQWVWLGAFAGLPRQGTYLEARSQVPSAALSLAETLKDQLGPDYSESITFIGHSLGTAVNAYAASLFINDTPGVDLVQFTALDRPDRIGEIPFLTTDDEPKFGYGRDFFNDVLVRLTRPIPDLRIENYYSLTGKGVGNTASGPVFNYPNLVSPSDLEPAVFSESLVAITDHSGVHQWYRWTIDPESLRSPLFPEDPVCEGSTLSSTYTNLLGLDASLNPCERGWYWALGSNPEYFPLVPGAPEVEFLVFPGRHDQFQSLGCLVNLFSINCTGSSSSPDPASGPVPETPSAAMVVDLPLDVRYITFEYRFLEVGAGDFAVFSIDGVPVWAISADDAGQSADFIRSQPIPIAENGSRLLSVSLFSEGEDSSDFELRNILFLHGLIFADDFESGDTSSWMGTLP